MRKPFVALISIERNDRIVIECVNHFAHCIYLTINIFGPSTAFACHLTLISVVKLSKLLYWNLVGRSRTSTTCCHWFQFYCRYRCRHRHFWIAWSLQRDHSTQTNFRREQFRRDNCLHNNGQMHNIVVAILLIVCLTQTLRLDNNHAEWLISSMRWQTCQKWLCHFDGRVTETLCRRLVHSSAELSVGENSMKF